MVKGKLIIIEAGDGCGKATQTKLLYDRLNQAGYKVKKIEYPDYESPACTPVKMYLQGEFGGHVDDVNAYAASVLFAVDRYASYRMKWKKDYEEGTIILADRYTTSNMVHQASKIKDDKEREAYLEWLIDLEWNKISIPEPDLIIFLDVPFEISQRLMKNRNNKITGEINKDIHEKDSKYLKDSYNIAKDLAEKYRWEIIECVKNDKLKSIEDINKEIMNKIKYIL